MKKKLMNEPQIELTIVLAASLVGPALAFLDNRATSVGINLVKNVKAGSNFPRGAFKIAAIELLTVAKDNTMDLETFKDALAGLGFIRANIPTKLTQHSKYFQRKGNSVVLRKGVKI